MVIVCKPFFPSLCQTTHPDFPHIQRTSCTDSVHSLLRSSRLLATREENITSVITKDYAIRVFSVFIFDLNFLKADYF